jgi:hypothetical protein
LQLTIVWVCGTRGAPTRSSFIRSFNPKS